jgi:hypothetical protein
MNMRLKISTKVANLQGTEGQLELLGDIWTWLENLRNANHLEVPSVHVRIILNWVLHKYNGTAWTGLIWLRIGQAAGRLVNVVMHVRVP